MSLIVKYFVVKRTSYLVVEASTESEALDLYSTKGEVIRSSAMCTHAIPIEVERGTDRFMEPFVAWDKAKILGVDRL